MRTPGEAGRDDDAGGVAGGASRKKGVRGRAEEALEALGRVSPSTNRPYPLTMVCETWRVARSSVYAVRARLGGSPVADRREPGKRGPKTALSDEELVEEIWTVLKASPFLGEGHRKVKARLAAKGIRVGKNRVLRLMRAHGLLAPVRRGHPRGDRTHSGQIQTEWPDELWGTDASRFWTRAEGWCWFFAAVDHCASDVVGWHVAKKGDRWAALEPVRQGVRAHMGGFERRSPWASVCGTTGVRKYRAKQFQAEIKWLGIRSTPAYVSEPECNGVAERFIRTLKEECIYLHDFDTLEEARAVIGAFIDRYNNGWLLQRHGYTTPARVRQKLSRRAA